MDLTELKRKAVALAMRRVLRPIAGRGRVRPPPLEGGRRLILLQLDGLSRTRLERAMARGLMPSLARRLSRRTHALSTCRAGTPPSTPAFQAGLFYGVAPSVPGFCWWDRGAQREVRMDRAADAAAVEKRLSRAASPGLLQGGTAYFSIFSGGAAVPHFCLSGIAGELSLDFGYNAWDTLASALVHSVTLCRVLARLGIEAGLGLWDGARWSAALGRLRNEPRFFLHRLLICALMREVAVQGLLVDVARGVPVVFCDFVGFDESGHRRGPDSPAAEEELGSIDAALELIFAAAEAVPELRYDVYLCSDHGQVPALPFESFTGLSLPEWLGRLADVAVSEAGDLAHVYLRGARRPLDLAALRAGHPRLLSALRGSPAIGIAAVRGGSRGRALVNGAELDLSRPSDVARLPHPEPQLVAGYLADLLSIDDSGDLVLLGWRGADREIVAYAWEFGSHGGVAPEEMESFLVHPRDRGLRFERAMGPEELHRFFLRAYRTPSRRPRAEEAPCPCA